MYYFTLRVIILCWPFLWLILLSRTIGCFFPLEACMVISGTLKANHREKALRSDPDQVPLVLCLKCMVSEAIRPYLLCLGGRQWQKHLLCFGSLLDNLDKQLKKTLIMPGVEVFARQSLAVVGSIIRPDRKILLIYICLFRLIMYISLDRQISIQFLITFSESILLFHPPLSFYNYFFLVFLINGVKVLKCFLIIF